MKSKLLIPVQGLDACQPELILQLEDTCSIGFDCNCVCLSPFCNPTISFYMAGLLPRPGGCPPVLLCAAHATHPCCQNKEQRRHTKGSRKKL